MMQRSHLSGLLTEDQIIGEVLKLVTRSLKLKPVIEEVYPFDLDYSIVLDHIDASIGREEVAGIQRIGGSVEEFRTEEEKLLIQRLEVLSDIMHKAKRPRRIKPIIKTRGKQKDFGPELQRDRENQIEAKILMLSYQQTLHEAYSFIKTWKDV